MKDFVIHLGRRFPIPPTVQIKHEIMRIVLDTPVQRPAAPASVPPSPITP